MGKAYQRFLKQGIDLAPLGVQRSTENAPYFCTPKGATILGWAGVDGIHYCFIRGFGEMVFAVSPMNIAPDFVHPLAETFTDFLRLLLACGDAGALEQAWIWEKPQFEAFLRNNPPTEAQQSTMAQLAGKMKLAPLEQPWEYLKTLQASFDSSKIQYTEDFYELDINPEAEPAAPEWKVFFDGNFWGHHGKDRAGRELPIGAQFQWAGRQWCIPAAYACAKGLVVDFCMRVAAEDIRAFLTKWNLSWEGDSYERLTREQEMALELDNPLCLNFNPRLELNGRTLRTSHGCAVSYNPCLPEGVRNELEAKWIVEHYGLDAADGWVICRDAFPWAGKRRPEIKTLSLTMEQQPVSLPGPHFKVNASGDTVAFLHPVSGTAYTLTVQEFEQQTLPEGAFGSDLRAYPTHYTTMSYTVSPELPQNALSVMDCAESDRPKEMPQSPCAPDASPDVAVVGVIGGADGPTAILFGPGKQEKLCAACSSLHFAPVPEVEWRMVFHETQFDRGRFSLLG